MTECQPEGLETMRDAVEEDLIEESTFEVEKPTITLRERAQNHLQTSTNEKYQHAKVKATRRRSQRRKGKFC